METLRRYYRKRHEAKAYGKWFWDQMRHHMLLVSLLALAGGILSVAGIGTAALNKWLVDDATASAGSFNIWIFLLLCLVMFINSTASSALSIGRTFLYEKFSFRMRKEFYCQLLRSDWQGLSSYHSGDLMTRITSDIDTVAQGMFGFFPSLVSLLFQFTTAFFVLSHYDLSLAVALLAISPVGMLLSLIMSRIYRKFQKETVENEAAYRSFLQESMEHLMLMKSFSLEEVSSEKMETFWKMRINILKKKNTISFFMGILMTLIFSGSYLLVFGWSVYRLSRNEISYGTLTLLLSLVSQIQSPIHNLQGLIQQMVGILVSSGRIMEITNLPQEKKGEFVSLGGAVGIKVEALSFSYDKNKEKVLKQIDFSISPGETIGIVGSSGAGKTTLIRLFLALINPDEGVLALYNETQEVIPISVDTRPYFSYVPQGNTLMSGTVRENLCLGNAGVSDSEIWAALKIAEAEEFIRKLPDELDFRILEKGGAISEGQAQRLAIARALLTKGKILILDEATAALDLETEAKIVENLKQMTKNLTCIVITHRLSLLDICRNVYRVDNGEVLSVNEHRSDVL